MAQLKCDRCGQTMDEKASVCSNCGAPLPSNSHSPPTEQATGKKSPKVLIVVTVTCLLLVGFVVTLFLNRENYESTPANKTEPLPNFQETKVKAEKGDPQAEETLGEIYAEGKQVPQDYVEAAKWYRKAAEQGLAKGQYNLGVLCDIGQGVPRDEAEAAKWHRKAAEQGNIDAQYALGGMYTLGRGVPTDIKEALKWYERAAEQGDALSRYNLAERYERGKTVKQDFVEAYKWHSLAAERGFQDAATARDNLKRQMTSEQLVEAHKRIRDFNANHPLTPIKK